MVKEQTKNIPSLCEQNWQCPECGITLKTDKRTSTEHECGESLQYVSTVL